MTNTLELEIAMKRAGISRPDVAKKLGISVMALFNKLHNKSEFRASEIAKLSNLLNLSSEQRDAIFFTYLVD